jgi:hypothetical protein
MTAELIEMLLEKSIKIVLKPQKPPFFYHPHELISLSTKKVQATLKH